MSEQTEQLKQRTRRFALDVLSLIKLLPRDEPGPTIKRQLTKAATSVDMNYRATCRARSHAEFTAKIGTVAEEADESASWLDLLAEGKVISCELLTRLQKEGHELEAIFSASAGTARRNARSRRTQNLN
jgi:four helix bundle protein